MQWLIDLIKEQIAEEFATKAWVQAQEFLTCSYVDRGNAFIPDFDINDFTLDAAWHDFDLSSIVPSGATAIAASVGIKADTVEICAQFRKKGLAGIQNRSWLNTQAANFMYTSDIVCGVDENGFLQYRFMLANWSSIFLTVKGWWL